MQAAEEQLDHTVSMLLTVLFGSSQIGVHKTVRTQS